MVMMVFSGNSDYELLFHFTVASLQIFDTDDREPLKAAYTENALFSFTCNFPDMGPESRLVLPDRVLYACTCPSVGCKRFW